MITTTSMIFIITSGITIYMVCELISATKESKKFSDQRISLLSERISRLEFESIELETKLMFNKYEHNSLRTYCEQNFTALYKKNWGDIAQQIDQSKRDYSNKSEQSH
jgi:hypothetical protein